MLSKENVQHIAKLARLELTEQETVKMQKDLSAILGYFDLLKKAKVPKRGKEKHSNILENVGIEKVTRKDNAQHSPASLANNLVAAAPDKKDGYIKVKNIF